jgi:hypothetical protein
MKISAFKHGWRDSSRVCYGLSRLMPFQSGVMERGANLRSAERKSIFSKNGFSAVNSTSVPELMQSIGNRIP